MLFCPSGHLSSYYTNRAEWPLTALLLVNTFLQPATRIKSQTSTSVPHKCCCQCAVQRRAPVLAFARLWSPIYDIERGLGRPPWVERS
jgi:hypothetical protein